MHRGAPYPGNPTLLCSYLISRIYAHNPPGPYQNVEGASRRHQFSMLAYKPWWDAQTVSFFILPSRRPNSDSLNHSRWLYKQILTLPSRKFLGARSEILCVQFLLSTSQPWFSWYFSKMIALLVWAHKPYLRMMRNLPVQRFHAISPLLRLLEKRKTLLKVLGIWMRGSRCLSMLQVLAYLNFFFLFNLKVLIATSQRKLLERKVLDWEGVQACFNTNPCAVAIPNTAIDKHFVYNNHSSKSFNFDRSADAATIAAVCTGLTSTCAISIWDISTDQAMVGHLTRRGGPRNFQRYPY